MKQHYEKQHVCRKIFHSFKAIICVVALMTMSENVMASSLLQQGNREDPIIVKGKVLDLSNSPIPGVTIRLKRNPRIGTSTNEEGFFSIKAEKNDTLIISSSGYRTHEYVLRGLSELTIKLQESIEQMDEVVVVGYGQQKRASVTGSVASISGKDLVTVKTPNVTNMLAGRLPGLRAVQRTGAPGDDGSSVDIRGYGSMLVIVDGVQRDFSQLNANDIESISILKDGAAAVYGFKGSNGVLLVTTKTGSESPARIEYNGFAGLQRVTRYPEMMNAYEYASLYNEAIYNTNPLGGVPAYTAQQLQAFENGGGTDWWGEMVRNNAPQSSHDLSISGGNSKLTYFTSVGYLNQGGILRSDDWSFSRYNFRSNITVEVAKGLKANLNVAGNFQDRKRPFEADNLFRQAQMAVPTYTVYANNNPDYWQAVGDMANPVHTSDIEQSGYEWRLRRQFNGSLTLSYQIPGIDGLQAKAMVAYDYNNSEWKTWKKDLSEYNYVPASGVYNKSILRSLAGLESSLENYYKPTQQYSLNYNKVFGGKNDISALVLYELYNDRVTSLTGKKDFTIGIIDDLDYGNKLNQSAGGLSKETSHAGLVGRVNYAFDKRYLAELSFRYDGSYKFVQSSRWGFFPGASLGWRVSEEPFFKKILPSFDNFKIRGSYAVVGDEGDFSAFQYLDGYVFSGNYVMGDQGITLGLANRGIANPWLTWYESRLMNVGFEASFKRGLLTAEFDWFRRNRSGLPATRQGTLPTTFGQTLPQENLNSDVNTGFEISIRHRHSIGEFKYNVSANFSTTRISNNYIERAGSLNMYDNWRNNNTERYKDIRWGKKVVGQFSSYQDILNSAIQDNNGNKSLLPGDLKFEDFNKDGIIDDNDTQPIGHGSSPRMYYGLNLSGSYKGFDFTLFMQGAAGHDVYMSGDVLDPFIQQGLGNGFAFMTDRWHRADPKDPSSEWIPGLMPAARVTGLSDNRSNNSWSLHTADYLRLKTVELGYTLPGKWLPAKGISRLRMYINGNNLLTFTSREGLMKYIDPEADNTGLRYYPQLKTMNFGVNLTL
ncbi:SusC/RagA family TonB-linked outer membrane protein [Pedobacter nototheniae]|uniref:SusC/RagA family TonB-linked outer membrane protein n=1 Tax=Pedobacter nototheniae TaxID=2488994 RepID=UPI00103F990C|nr:TonB-dependent receptor [Pedobacter nototheniae]